MRRKDTPPPDDPSSLVSIDSVLNHLMISALSCDHHAAFATGEERLMHEAGAAAHRETAAWLKEYTA